MNVLFVCTGNTCRSPMAEALLKDKLPQMNVQSAGIYASEGMPANENAMRALQDRNIPFVHSSQLVTKDLLEWADIVLTMTTAHQQMLKAIYPEYETRMFTLIEYATNSHSYEHLTKDIADPFGRELQVYKETLLEIEEYMEHVIKKMKS